MKEILQAIDEKREELRDCKLYRFLADETVEAPKRMLFAPHVAYFSMSFGDLMRTVLPRREPVNELDEYVNAHCTEDDYHWEWYLEDIEALGLNDEDFTSSCRKLWSKESAPVRHMIYSVIKHASRSEDPLLHLIIIEILEAGLSGFFEHCYKDVSTRGMSFLKYFGETHYNAEYDHTLTSWFQVDDLGPQKRHHPLAKFEPGPEVRALAAEAIEEIFDHFHKMYDCWHEAAARQPV